MLRRWKIFTVPNIEVYNAPDLKHFPPNHNNNINPIPLFLILLPKIESLFAISRSFNSTLRKTLQDPSIFSSSGIYRKCVLKIYIYLFIWVRNSDRFRKIVRVGIRKIRNSARFGRVIWRMPDRLPKLIRTTSTNPMFKFSQGRIWYAQGSAGVGVEKSSPLRIYRRESNLEKIFYINDTCSII